LLVSQATAYEHTGETAECAVTNSCHWTDLGIKHEHATELAKIGEILDSHPGMAGLIEQDLVRGVRYPGCGARGMSGDRRSRYRHLPALRTSIQHEFRISRPDRIISTAT